MTHLIQNDSSHSSLHPESFCVSHLMRMIRMCAVRDYLQFVTILMRWLILTLIRMWLWYVCVCVRMCVCESSLIHNVLKRWVIHTYVCESHLWETDCLSVGKRVCLCVGRGVCPHVMSHRESEMFNCDGVVMHSRVMSRCEWDESCHAAKESYDSIRDLYFQRAY